MNLVSGFEFCKSLDTRIVKIDFRGLLREKEEACTIFVYFLNTQIK